MSKLQSVKSKQGEVKFRRKLALQFNNAGCHYPGEPSGQEYLEIVKETFKNYTDYFQELAGRNIKLGPFLEIGAGVAQAGMLLESQFQVEGFSSELSLETIQLAGRFKRQLGFKKQPVLLCCDGYNLPFKSNSLPFVFCFQTLHHLPDPKPVLAEVYRVLQPGGYFYFNNEPIAQAINLNLWRRDMHLTIVERLLKGLLILHFISRIGKSEVEHHILEETFSLATWEKALNTFDSVEATLTTFPFGPTTKRTKTAKAGWLKPTWPKRILLEILGGGMAALCQKKPAKSSRSQPMNKLLACPNCRQHSALVVDQGYQQAVCQRCRTKYCQKDGVLMLLSKKEAELLYHD